MGRRRRYDREFKMEAIRLITGGRRKAIEVSRDLGIHPNLLYNWKRHLAEDPQHAFRGQGRPRPGDEELRNLKRELADVKEECNISKKALRYETPVDFENNKNDLNSVSEKPE